MSVSNIPDHPLLAEVHKALQSKDYITSEQLLRQVLEKEPNNGRAFYYLGHFNIQKNKNLASAAQAYKKAIDLDATCKDEVSLRILGGYEEHIGNYGTAITYLEEVLKLAQHMHHARTTLAHCYLRKGMLYESISCLQTAVEAGFEPAKTMMLRFNRILLKYLDELENIKDVSPKDFKVS